jgi:hypothetical protein
MQLFKFAKAESTQRERERDTLPVAAMPLRGNVGKLDPKQTESKARTVYRAAHLIPNKKGCFSVCKRAVKVVTPKHFDFLPGKARSCAVCVCVCVCVCVSWGEERSGAERACGIYKRANVLHSVVGLLLLALSSPLLSHHSTLLKLNDHSHHDSSHCFLHVCSSSLQPPS